MIEKGSMIIDGVMDDSELNSTHVICDINRFRDDFPI